MTNFVVSCFFQASGRGKDTMKMAPDVACDNPECPQVGVKGTGNVLVRRQKNGIRYVRCRTCHQEFSERRGTLSARTKKRVILLRIA